MSLYRTSTNFAVPAALDAGIHILGSATLRLKLSEFVVSSPASPVEQTTEMQIQRVTDAGTTPGATLTAESVDPLSQAATAVVEGDGYATEPTPGDIMKEFSVHQKAIYRWVAYPGREIHSVAAANNGIVLSIIQQSVAYALTLSVEWME